MRAWLFRDPKQLQKRGDDCPWSVGWYDPEGKKRQKAVGSKSLAEKYARKMEGQLAAGTYLGQSRKGWSDFRAEYDAKILPRQAPRTRPLTTSALNAFERICKPQKVATITTQLVDEFIATRQAERGKKKGAKVSPATVNRELRHLKAVFRVASEWGYLPKLPRCRKVKEDDRMGKIITPAHFQAIYSACDAATMPAGEHYTPGEWWQALLVFAMTTGWRIGEILAFRRDDLDLATGSILTRADDNKGGRDDVDYLPAAALELVKGIVGFGPLVFSWPHHDRTLWAEFWRIQASAGVKLECRSAGQHECTDACRYYGFHALRRGYATMNAETMPAPVLQKKMRHKSFTTTLRYIGLADKMKQSAEAVYVPEFLRRAK